MAGSKVSSLGVLAVVFLAYAVMASAVAHSPAPAPSPSPTNDGTSIDQGIAYALMLVALVLTYLIH